MKILKTFENYENAGPSDKKGVEHPVDPNKEEINEKIKVIINNIIKVKTQFKMLKDTTEHVHELMMKQFPKATQGFIEELNSRDDILADMVETIYDNIHDSEALSEIEEIIKIIDEMQEYTDDNLDAILNQENDFEEDDYDDIEFEDGEDADLMDVDEEEISKVVAKPTDKKKDLMKCPVCLGSGMEPGGEDFDEACDHCDGLGLVQKGTSNPKKSPKAPKPSNKNLYVKKVKGDDYKIGDNVKIVAGSLKGQGGKITEFKNGKYFIGAIGPIPKDYLEKI
jgi:hypothetical protein